MKVLVLGSGVIGVTSAHYLAEAGHEVTVIDRQPGPALETSFANAGEVSPGYSAPWAGPGVPVKAIKWLLMQHGPLVVRPALDPYMWSWLVKMLRNCTANQYAVNKARMVPIAEYARDCLRDLRASTAISYDERSQGTGEDRHNPDHRQGLGTLDDNRPLDERFIVLGVACQDSHGIAANAEEDGMTEADETARAKGNVEAGSGECEDGCSRRQCDGEGFIGKPGP